MAGYSTNPLGGQEAIDRHEFWTGGQERRRLQNVLRGMSRIIDCGDVRRIGGWAISTLEEDRSLLEGRRMIKLGD